MKPRLALLALVLTWASRAIASGGGEDGLDGTHKALVLLYRVLGSDLPGFTTPNHTLEALRFTLAHEPDLPGVRKRWLLHRVADPALEAELLALLRQHGATHRVVPFELTAYAALPVHASANSVVHGRKRTPHQARLAAQLAMHHERLLYVAGANSAKNAMVDEGVAEGYRWVLPWDGDVFVGSYAWPQVAAALRAADASGARYAVVHAPPAPAGEHLLQCEGDGVKAAVHADTAGSSATDGLFGGDGASSGVLSGSKGSADSEQLQLAFRADTEERFDAAQFVAHGIGGTAGPCQHVVQQAVVRLAAHADSSSAAGAADPTMQRLPELHADPGHRADKGGNVQPGAQRAVRAAVAALQLLGTLDARVAAELAGFDAAAPLLFDARLLAAAADAVAAAGGPVAAAAGAGPLAELLRCADAALGHGPWSVVDKRPPPPPDVSPHDYFTNAPYNWPLPPGPDGKPRFKKRDGQRVPGTVLYDDASDAYDRSRLNSMVGNTTCLALAWAVARNPEHAAAAARNIVTFLVDPATAMAPHLRHAQRGQGCCGGTIETRDICYVLDAARLLAQESVLSGEQMAGLRAWVAQYYDYLTTAHAHEWTARNNHGTWYDFQVSCYALFLGDVPTAARLLHASRARMAAHYADNATLPRELKRALWVKYVMFDQFGWYEVARIAARLGIDLWGFSRAVDGGVPLLLRGSQASLATVASALPLESGRISAEELQHAFALYHIAAARWPQEMAAWGKWQGAPWDTPPPPDSLDPQRYAFWGAGTAWWWNLFLDAFAWSPNITA